MQKIDLNIDRELYDKADRHKARYIAEPESERGSRPAYFLKPKNEPEWMLKKGFRHWNCSTKRPCLNGTWTYPT